MGLQYYIIDTETTGLNPAWHEMIEISIIRCSDKHQLTRHIIADYPERADLRALLICKKTKYDLYRGENKLAVVEKCEQFWNEDGLTPEHRCLIAHNASFDKRFCHALWEKVGKQFPVTCWLDTVKYIKTWAKKIGSTQKSFKLAAALDFAGITPLPGAHASGVDARNTYLLWKTAMDKGINHLSSIKRYPHNYEPVNNKH